MSRQEQQRTKRIRHFVIKRDGLACCYCNSKLTDESVTLDHIIPDSQNGPFSPTNLTVACFSCNNLRGDQAFFEFCLKYNFSPKKLLKYKQMHDNAIKVNILNIAKEEFLKGKEYAIPYDIIKLACKQLKIKQVNFDYCIKTYKIDLNLNKMIERSIIKYWFEILIRKINGEI